MSVTPAFLFTLAAVYHPEHLLETSWSGDIRLMREAGVGVVGLGESAWAALEPAPGEFSFAWLDAALAALAEAGIQVVLTTPVAAPPAWLDQPEVFAVDGFGGSRTHPGYCLNAEPLRQAGRRLLAAIAEHFGANLNIIGWQLHLPTSFDCTCTRCQDLFQDFLRQRYDSLASLNDSLAAAGHALAMADWRHIRITHAFSHPLLQQEHRRWRQRCRQSFLGEQEAVLRSFLPPGVWITSVQGNDADEIAIPPEEGAHSYLALAAGHDLARFRDHARPPGYIARMPIRISQDLGLTRLRAWQALAHGADVVLLDRWRAAQPGLAQPSVLGPSGQTRPIYDEIRWLGRDIARVQQIVAGSRPAAEVAILYDEQSQWYVDEQALTKPVTYRDHLLHYARPFVQLNIPIEFVEATASLRPFDLVFAPSLAVLTPSLADQLKDYVRRGGRLVLAGPCGLVDERLCPATTRPPGLLAEAAGVEVTDFYRPPAPAPVNGNWFSGVAHPWAERLQTGREQVVIVARYGHSNGWLDEQIAITVSPLGRGLIYYVGAFLDVNAQHDLLKHIAATAKVQPLMDAPAGVEVTRRIAADRRELWFILNHRLQEQTITLPWLAFDHVGQRPAQGGELTLLPYGVAVLTRG